MAEAVKIVEVGPRDGLQNEKQAIDIPAETETNPDMQIIGHAQTACHTPAASWQVLAVLHIMQRVMQMTC